MSTPRGENQQHLLHAPLPQPINESAIRPGKPETVTGGGVRITALSHFRWLRSVTAIILCMKSRFPLPAYSEVVAAGDQVLGMLTASGWRCLAVNRREVVIPFRALACARKVANHPNASSDHSAIVPLRRIW